MGESVLSTPKSNPEHRPAARMEGSSDTSMGISASVRFFLRPAPAPSNTKIKLKEGTNHGYEATEYPDPLGRRHRHVECQLLQPRHDGLPNPEHRPRRQRR